jgi:hypothetical protein
MNTMTFSASGVITGPHILLVACPFTELRTVRLVPNPELAIPKTHDDTVFAETSRCRLLIGCDQLNANSTRRRWCARAG